MTEARREEAWRQAREEHRANEVAMRERADARLRDAISTRNLRELQAAIEDCGDPRQGKVSVGMLCHGMLCYAMLC